MDVDDGRYTEAKALLTAGDIASAEVLLRTGVAAGHLPSAYRLGELLVSATDPARQAEGCATLRMAAEAGNAKASFLLGLLHAHGRAGAERDPAAAARWCEAAARQGLPEAQFNLGLIQALGSGTASDPVAAADWLRRAAFNGVAEAEGCLDILYQERGRPRTWDEADTRVSIALARTNSAEGKPLRFAEYYVDPAIDLLAQRFNLRRDEIEDATQQFFLELEEPLSRGEQRGKARKDAIRTRYDPARGAFRPYLARALVNFVRNWIRDRDREPDGRPMPEPPPDTEALVADQAAEWGAVFEAFAAATAPRRPDAARAIEALRLLLIDDLPQSAIAGRIGVSDRTVRTAIRLGADLLREWCQARIAELPAGNGGLQRLHAGIDLLPVWLHYPSSDKRVRTLLLLAVIRHRLGDVRIPG